ncbi:MAG: putative 2-aminoethylphosphonate ABC transporter ATP-binding protein [Hyphomicrobiaceae bacterium]
MPGYLEVSNLSKTFGDFVALDDVGFEIQLGEFVCFLGPSGCGKTTLLRCIAGLESQSAGTITQAGQDISRLPPSRRDFGIVFQSYALFPNLSVEDNIGFALSCLGRPAADIASRVGELVALIGLGGHERKFPAQLSGGQQQRVALARALAPSPGLLLLDEPLSALDAKVRAHLRREIRNLQTRLGVTTIMVTHDQEEAQTMADRILVMRDGRVEQIGTPAEIYDRPASPFVADFIGVMNFMDGIASGGEVICGDETLTAAPEQGQYRGPVKVAFRPEDVVIGQRAAGGNNLVATVTAIEALGSFVRVYLALRPGAPEIIADVRKDGAIRTPLNIADRVPIHVPPAALRLYPRQA